MKSPLHLLARIREEFFPQSDEFDRAHGVQTAGKVWRWRMDVPFGKRKGAVTYKGVTPGNFSKAVAALPREARAMPFIDLGCGKGRALILAHEAGFREITGVEFSRSLANIATRNVSNWPHISVHCDDATAWRFKEKHALIFMYNPFDGEVMRRAMENIREQGVTGYVLYLNAFQEQEIERAGGELLTKGSMFSIWKLTREY